MEECIFCKIAADKAKSWKVYEDENVCAFLDVNPISRFHTLVIPKVHHENIFEIPDEELREVISVVGKLTKTYKNKLGIENIQIINNNGREAQQDVFHLHYHIIPRKYNDGQKVKWQTYPKLRKEFDTMLDELNMNEKKAGTNNP